MSAVEREAIARPSNGPLAFAWGGIVALLGGLIGLGGAEFRLPVLMGVLRVAVLAAVVANLAISRVTVTFSLVFRAGVTGVETMLAHGGRVLPLLAGSRVGAHVGTAFASRIRERALRRVVAALLVLLSLVFMAHPFIDGNPLPLGGAMRTGLGILSGLVIGVVSSLLGVAGGELIIPTLVLLYALTSSPRPKLNETERWTSMVRPSCSNASSIQLSAAGHSKATHTTAINRATAAVCGDK